ncbi:MAG: hypothetical protein IBX45_07975 [Campylobacterales bacterium]|nr:hypothetical protein [Campylobacterales bacterium]
MNAKFLKTTLLAVLGAMSLSAATPSLDPETGLVIAHGFDEVKTNCTACHSAKFITLQRGDRETWLGMIRWMQKTQGLWEFDATLENTILDYLSEHYAAGQASRRPHLKPSLLPVNPYE